MNRKPGCQCLTCPDSLDKKALDWSRSGFQNRLNSRLGGINQADRFPGLQQLLVSFFWLLIFCKIEQVFASSFDNVQFDKINPLSPAIFVKYKQTFCNAQWSRCQLGCSGSQNLPGRNYRRIICSCSYYMEHAKILL